MNEIKITGRIIAALPVKSGTSANGNQWQSQEYVIETEGQYPKKCVFQIFGDNIAKINLQLGITYTVDLDIDAREYQGRWYNTLRCWRANPAGAAQPQAAPVAAPQGILAQAAQEPHQPNPTNWANPTTPITPLPHQDELPF